MQTIEMVLCLVLGPELYPELDPVHVQALYLALYPEPYLVHVLKPCLVLGPAHDLVLDLVLGPAHDLVLDLEHVLELYRVSRASDISWPSLQS